MTRDGRAPASRQRGITLVETVMAIVIGGIVLASIAGALAWAARHSADALPVKQSLAVADALLNEVGLKAFTYCDADDPAPGTSSCSAPGYVNGIGPEAGETRYSATTPFDHPDDYNGFSMTGIRQLSNDAVPGLSSYSASVAVAAPASSAQGLSGVPPADSLWVTVTVTGPTGDTLTLKTFRARYAP